MIAIPSLIPEIMLIPNIQEIPNLILEIIKLILGLPMMIKIRNTPPLIRDLLKDHKAANSKNPQVDMLTIVPKMKNMLLQIILEPV